SAGAQVLFRFYGTPIGSAAQRGSSSVSSRSTRVAVPPGAPPARLALAGTRPNPSRDGRFMVELSLASHQDARLEVVDVSGRRLVARDVSALGPGAHVVDLA